MNQSEQMQQQDEQHPERRPWQDVHRRKVEGIAAQIRARLDAGQRVHFVKDTGHHVVPLPGDGRFGQRPVDISPLNQVLEVDPEARTCVCEPNVTFRQLLQATLAHGLIPAVVPELQGITVGGAVAGCSVEAMSFRYGGFHDNALEYELVDGEGQIRRCSPEQEPELFEMVHGSYGTLALLSCVTFKLYPAKPFVRLDYRHFRGFPRFHDELLRQCDLGEVDFIDGIIHGPNHHVICLGSFVDEAPYTSDYRGEQIFYKSTRERESDYLTTEDYCFRYDTECHWLSRAIPPLEWPWVRRNLGKYLLGSDNLIAWSNRMAPLLSLQRRPDVVCDVFIPAARFEEFFLWYQREFCFYPLWIVPYRAPQIYPWIAEEHGRRMEAEMTGKLIIDCAVYGRPNRRRDVDYSQLLEEQTYQLNGIKTLISRNHHSEERFWQVFNRPNHRAAKAALDPRGTFPELFSTFGRVE